MNQSNISDKAQCLDDAIDSNEGNNATHYTLLPKMDKQTKFLFTKGISKG